MMKKIVGIYKITSPSGKVYIGQSWNVKHRWADYGKSTTRSQTYLNHSFIKYGKKAHAFDVIHELPNDCSQSILDLYEQLYMDLYRDCGAVLMNIREAGSRGKLSEETKRKVSQGLIGNVPWNKGKKGYRVHSEDHKLKLSEAKKGLKPNNFGKPRSVTACIKTALKNRGQKRTPEQLQRIREARKIMGPQMGGKKNKGKIRTEVHRRNLGESLRRSGKGRGENHNLAKVTEAQVLEIRSKFIPREYSSRKLAKEYGIAKTTILDIVNRKIWVHI
jgi:group I intron endonuclease